MNAVASDLVPLSPLTEEAVKNIDILTALQVDPGPESLSDLARQVNRDRSNLKRTLRVMADEGLIDWPDDEMPLLATAGYAALDAWTRAHAPPLDTTAPPATGRRTLPLDIIDDWPDQPRKQPRSPASLEDLAVSIADKGVEQAITVRPSPSGTPGRFQVVIGAGRLEAARHAVNQQWLPADWQIPAEVEDLDDDEAFERAVIENVQREDLHWMDEAKAMLRMHLPRPEGMGRSGAQIARIFGNRGKRSVQDYTKIARELPAEDVARCYLPEGDPERLTYVKARDLVGDKGPKLALDLSPKLALTYVELIHAGHPVPGGVVTKIHRPPAGGPMPGLAERQLIAWKFEDGQPATYVPLDDRVSTYLTQIGYTADPAACLFRLRAEALPNGELDAAKVEPGRYVTEELNAPIRETADQLAREVFGAPTREALGEPVRGETEDDDEDGDIPDYLRNLAGPGAPVAPPSGEGASAPAPVPEGFFGTAAIPPATPQPAPQPEPLPPLLALVVVEVAAKTFFEGVERAPGHWGCPIGADWHRDARLGTLIQKHGLLTIVAMGTVSLVCLTDKAHVWLADTCDAINLRPDQTSPEGRAKSPDHWAFHWLCAMQTRFAGQPAPEPGPWLLTPWLNIPDAPPDAQAGALTAAPARPQPSAAEALRVLASYDGLLGQVDALLARCATATKPPKADIAQIRQMIDNTRAVGKPLLEGRA